MSTYDSNTLRQEIRRLFLFPGETTSTEKMLTDKEATVRPLITIEICPVSQIWLVACFCI